MNKEEYYFLGRITKMHGYKGEVVILLDTDNPDIYEKLKAVFIEINESYIPFFIDSLRITPGNKAIAKFHDVDSVEKAQKLIKKQIFVPSDSIPQQDKMPVNEQITGFDVVDVKHGNIGKLKGIIDNAYQSIMQVDHKSGEILIPMVDEIIIKIDRKKKLIEVDLPEGLIDLYTKA